MARGTLRVYLGSAPGVGKTYHMLDEGWRRHERGTDVVVAFVETHGRSQTLAQLRDLEVVPRAKLSYRESQFEEMDLGAVLARHPEVALVDEFAHTNVPGSKNAKRWQDVEELLDAGINVITTVNVQHLESVNDVVEKITGITQQETIPDAVVRRAEQIELVDITPEALRRRMAHGNIYAADKIDASLSNYFRSGNLTALRELALLWLADRVEDALQQYMEDHGIGETWETRERLIVALTGTETDDILLRRAARIASRSGAELIAVHVVNMGGPRRKSTDTARARELVAELNGRYQELVDDDIATALVAFARSERGTQIVLGASRPRSALHPPSGVVESVLRRTRDLDVHVIAVGGERPPRVRRQRQKQQFSRRRQLNAAVIGVLLMPLLTIIMTQLRASVSLSTVSLIYLVALIGLTMWGGLVVGLAVALVAAGLENFYFAPPIHTLQVARPDDVVSLVVFFLFAIGASLMVNQFSRGSNEAERARTEAEILTNAAGTVAATRDDLTALLDSLRAIFELPGISLMMKKGEDWVTELESGEAVSIEESTAQFEIDDEHLLVLAGASLDTKDRTLVTAFARRVAAGLRSQHLQEEAIELRAKAEAATFRTGFLRAVSKDLRAPLETIQEDLSSLLDPEDTLSPHGQHTLLVNVDREVRRLSRLVTNLMYVGRLRAGVVVPALAETSIEDLLESAMDDSDTYGIAIEMDVSKDLPVITTDAELVGRVIANVVSNACRFSPGDQPVRISAGVAGDNVEVLVMDRGPGLKSADKDTLLAPIERLSDESASSGLGLTVALGFMKLLGGHLHFEDTPGGGLTVAIELPCSASNGTQSGTPAQLSQ